VSTGERERDTKCLTDSRSIFQGEKKIQNKADENPQEAHRPAASPQYYSRSLDPVDRT